MKKLLTFLWVLLLAQVSIAQQVTVPSANTNGTSDRKPLTGWFGYERSHMLYTGSEINSSGNIIAISFYLNSVGSPAASPVEVYLKLSSNTSITSSTVANAESGATLVWSGTIPASSFIADSWVTINLTTPFAYNPGSNLEVLVKNNAGGAGNEATSTSKLFRHSATSATQFQYWYKDNSEPTDNGTTSSNRPNIRLDLAPNATNTVGISGVISPAGSCNLTASTPVSVRIRNNGTADQNNVTIPVFYSINNGTAVAGSFSGSIASGTSANYTFATPANLSAPGTYTFKFWTAMPGDESTVDDILQNYTITKIAPATITPVTFDNYDGSNLSTTFTGWAEGAGQAKPIGTTSSWGNNTGLFNDAIARVELYAASKREWIYSPMFVPSASNGLSFKTGIRDYYTTSQTSAMGSDDSLNVRITTDCGATWKTIYSITAANAPTALEKTELTIPLATYAGQEVRIGFFATEGVVNDPEDYWVALDDIQLVTLEAINTGITEVVSPKGNCGLYAATPVTVRIRNFGTATQSNIPVQYTINGGTPVTATYTGSLVAGATELFTFPTPANLSVPSTYVVEAKTLLVGDIDVTNDAASATSTKVAAQPLAAVNFTGFDGSNLNTAFPGWSEATGQAKPTGTTSYWTNNNALYGNDVARVELYGSSRKEWIYSPVYNPATPDGLSFKLGIRDYYTTSQTSVMGSDDSLNVKITTDCGTTWKTIYSITAANAPTALTLTEYTIPLATYAGQDIRVAFVATEGVVNDPEDYWISLDDIQIVTLFPNNVGLTKLVSPTGNCGLSAATPITVNIRNFGTSAQTNIPVQYTINGGTPVTATYTGNLASGATTLFTFPTTADLSVPSTYNIQAKTLLANDADVTNDTASSTVTRVAPQALLPVNFTGFDGSNLNTVFPGWREGTGQTKPIGTTSAWVSNNTLLNDPVARVELYGSSKKEWMYGPIFYPTSLNDLNFTVALRDYYTTSQTSAMGSDDSLNVRITTDCGATWKTIYSITAANAPTSLEKTMFTVSLAAYAGQEARIAFFATEGSVDDAGDYWVLLDDIELITSAPNNIGVTQILSPVGNCGLSATTPVTVRLRNFGTAEQSNIPLQYTVNGGTPVTATYTGSLAANTNTTFTFPTPVNLSAPGTYKVQVKTLLANDADISNDTASSTVTKLAPQPLAAVNFTGFDGANLSSAFPGWAEGTGQTAPTGTTSAWGSNSTLYNNDVARVELYSVSKKEWMYSPLYTPAATDGFSFKIGIRDYYTTGQTSAMGSDDSLNVRITTDCGATWQTIYSITAANAPTALTLTEIAVPLANYAGQEVRLALFATEGVSNDIEDYWISIDDIQIRALVPNDLGVIKIISPNQTCGLGNSTTVSVKIRNFGTEAQSNFPVKYSVNNATVTETFAGTLAAGDSATYDFTTPATVSVPQTYNIQAWTALSTDVISNNNTATYSFVIYGSPLNVVTFANYAVDNVIGEGWSEAIGGTAVQGDSPWKTGGISGNATGRVTLSGDSITAWI
ncbi:CARDB protein, partial [Flexibacter flexilis DSM 6793]